jgi:hypothetical protein
MNVRLAGKLEERDAAFRVMPYLLGRCHRSSGDSSAANGAGIAAGTVGALGAEVESARRPQLSAEERKLPGQTRTDAPGSEPPRPVGSRA